MTFFQFYLPQLTFSLVEGNKKRTFVYQKFLFCLSIAKAMVYHHDIVVDIIATGEHPEYIAIDRHWVVAFLDRFV